MDALEKLLENYPEDSTFFGRDTDGSLFVIHPVSSWKLDEIGWWATCTFPLGEEVNYLIACAGEAWTGKPEIFDDEFPGPTRLTKKQAYLKLAATFYP